MTDAASLTTALVLEQKGRTPDGGGGWEVAWTPLGTLWAAVRSSSGREGVLGARAHGRVTHKVRVRWAAPTSPRRPRADQRFMGGTRAFDILAVTEARERGFLDCWCEEGPLS